MPVGNGWTAEPREMWTAAEQLDETATAMDRAAEAISALPAGVLKGERGGGISPALSSFELAWQGAFAAIGKDIRDLSAYVSAAAPLVSFTDTEISGLLDMAAEGVG